MIDKTSPPDDGLARHQRFHESVAEKAALVWQQIQQTNANGYPKSDANTDSTDSVDVARVPAQDVGDPDAGARGSVGRPTINAEIFAAEAAGDLALASRLKAQMLFDRHNNKNH